MSYYGYNKPDGYAFIKIQAYGAQEAIVKVFASWTGSYTHGESWRLNSGCTSIEDAEDGYVVTGYSGTQYLLSKTHNYIRPYNKGVLDDMIAELRSYGHQADIISIEEAMAFVRNIREQ